MSNLLQSAPKNMLYNLQAVPAIEVKSALRRFDATIASGFTGGGQNEARIPISSMDAFLDTNKSYLFFNVAVATAAASIDFTAGSFIDRLEIQSNGRTLWRADRYALYHNLRKAYNSDVADVEKLNSSEGSRGLITQLTAAAFAQHGIENVGVGGLGEEIGAGESRNYCIDLECGLLHNDLKKALPQGSNMEIVVRFNQNNQAICAHTGAPTWTINNVRFYSHSYQVLNAEAENFYNQMRAQGAVSWSGDYLKTYINELPAAATTHTLQINDRSLSAKCMITCVRQNGFAGLAKATNSTPQLSISGGGAITQYEYMIAGSPVPSSGPIDVETLAAGQNLGRAYEEAVKCLVDNGESHGKSFVGKAAFAGAFNTIDANKSTLLSYSKGIVCVDLRKMDDMSLRMKGIDTASSAAPNNVRITHTALTSGAADATTFVVADALWSLQSNGEITVSV
jgi:hypothetical protein